MEDNVLVIGGYGSVGRHISTELGARFPGNVIAAGRSYERAKEFAETSNGDIVPLEFDVFADLGATELLEDVGAVVMCVPQQRPGFVKSCLDTATHYIDITEPYPFLSKVEALDDVARSAGATAVLSVGLSPGISNLLVKHGTNQLDAAEDADIFVLVGMGNGMGAAPIAVMLDHLPEEIEIHDADGARRFKNFDDGKQTTFPEGLGERTAYRFDFPEPHVLPRTLQLERVSHRICFDSRLMTRSMHLLQRAGFWNVLRSKPVKLIFLNLFQLTTGRALLGSDVIVIKAEISGALGGEQVTLDCAAIGHEHNRIVGKVAALITEQISSGAYPSGVHHIDELFELTDVMPALADELTFYLEQEPIATET